MAGTIAAAGLETYYETRTAFSSPPPAALAAPRAPAGEGATEAALILDGVRCAACLWLIEQRLARLAGVLRAQVNYATQRAHIAWDAGRTDLVAIIEAVRAIGYDAYPYEPRRQDSLELRSRRMALWRLFVAGFGAMQVMMYAFPAYIDEGALTPDIESLMRWASLLLTLPVLLFACGPFFAGARQELRLGRIGLDTPIALGLGLGFAGSAWATFTGTGEVYFDCISMIAFLLLGARYLEAAARRRAARALDPLLRWSDAPALAVGAQVAVAPGERVPADGVVLSGRSSADESLLTGESRPIAKRAGDELAAGSVNLEQPLVMRVTRVGADTRAAGIARLVERGAASKPRLVAGAERVARHLTWIIVLTAGVAGLASGNPWVALAVLVVACPCALGLAAPTVLTRAAAVLLARGALLTRAGALEALERATDVVLDKTGTLTTGRVALRQVHLLRPGETAQSCTALAASLEKASRHPIARAFRGGAHVVDDPRQEPGQGLEGRIGGRRLRIGTAAFCAALCGLRGPELAASGTATRVFLADERGFLAAFDLEDDLRPEAGSLVEALERRGLRVHLASGDAPAVVAAVAERVGIARHRGAMTPQDKYDYVARLQREGRIVVMIGDGLNDAPVLARADASLAMGSGADAAQLNADVVLNAGLAQAREVLAVSRRAMRLVRQNIGWALAYNAVALPLAAVGWIGPWEAALAMGASSLTVVLNALRPLGAPAAWKASTSSFPSPSPSYS